MMEFPSRKISINIIIDYKKKGVQQDCYTTSVNIMVLYTMFGYLLRFFFFFLVGGGLLFDRSGSAILRHLDRSLPILLSENNII